MFVFQLFRFIRGHLGTLLRFGRHCVAMALLADSEAQFNLRLEQCNVPGPILRSGLRPWPHIPTRTASRASQSTALSSAGGFGSWSQEPALGE